MAKSGQIQLKTGAPGDKPLADSVVFTESTPTSLGGIVADLLDKSDDALKIIVDPIGRNVQAFASDYDVTGALDGEGKKLIGTITRDDATKRSSPVTMAAGDDISGNAALTALAAQINGMFAAAKPSKNVSTIVNAVEDSIAALAALDDPIVITQVAVIVDQTGDGSVKIYGVVTGIEDEGGALAALKQVPQSTTSGPAPLAFE